MEYFTTNVMPYINFGLTVLVGFVLGFIIRHKNSLISTLTAQFKTSKDLLDMYDIGKIKEMTELRVQNEAEKYRQKELKLDGQIKSTIENISRPWLEKYNELIDFELYYLLNYSTEKREQVLKLLPKNRDFIEGLIRDIKSGELKPS
tara:strand:- start:442 stop:882 length:441 start_codon:yes stop_codon:yes gene_type:complete